MSEAGEFVDAALQRESSWERADEHRERLGGALQYYGSSVGAVRGTVRDLTRRHPGLSHDEVTALSSELWAAPVFERRLAAIVLLQSNVALLDNSDLTRVEGFVRGARLRALVDPLAVDVIGPMVEGLTGQKRARADIALDRWAQDDDVWLRRAALLSPLRAFRAGRGDEDGLARRVATVRARHPETDIGADAADAPDSEAIALVRAELAEARPGLRLP
ncbi:DNA alkylation repair protein [Compostimonas suwonensis]|uniref:DNA alkylation repair enzyme n=1 Tax=Compostimonas suwonensis TaxID=1048394 RepID=A0A2M9BBG3_9MICO|nr:DNA alkylation repair protein [Compostimonas suwonensis]PJJ55276.1 DNA alkylation repair enzyme [Compostimonas suwonensis]